MGKISQSFRLKVLDQCLRNKSRDYTIEDLIEECKRKFIERKGTVEGVSKKTIYNDLNFIRERYDIELKKEKDGKYIYYSYEDSNFSIDNEPLTEDEARLIKTAIQTILSFSGLPQFDHLESLARRLDSQFNFVEDHKNIIGFENNLSLTGLNFLKDIFNSINDKQVLKISYQSFKSQEPREIIFHPYYMKQYNSRWFVFGLNPEFDKMITNLAIDRIKEIKKHRKMEFLENDEDFQNDYFYDFIGVTDVKEEIIELRLSVEKSRWKYMDSKPFHHSYKVINHNNDKVEVSFSLKPNKELISKILEYGKDVEVISPASIRNQIKDIVAELNSKYM